MRNGRRRGAKVLVVAVIASVALLPAASGDEWGDQDQSTGAHPDENPHTYCFSASIGNGLEQQIDAAEYQALDPTHANVNYHATCTMTGQSETDVYWKQANLSGLYGKAPCNNYEVIGDQCDQYHVTLDLAAINAGDYDGIHQTIVACHELGHTVGLSHRDGNCMRATTPDTPPTDIDFRRYDPGHHIPDHINTWF